jgi:amidase
MTELCFMTALELRAALGRREVSAREVVQAHLDQIERFNPDVNAVVTLVAERALDSAAAADRRAASGADLPALHGLPVAHKDVHETAGIRTTYGSPVRAQYVPAEDELVIERMHAAGVITLGKTNVPEFGAGSHTFNPVFGATRNPYHRSRSAARPWRWPAGCTPSRTAATWADRCAIRRRSTMWWGSGRHRAGCRAGRRCSAGPR